MTEKALARRLNSVFNVKALAGAFNQEKVLVGAFSVIVKSSFNLRWTPAPAPPLHPVLALVTVKGPEGELIEYL